MWEPIVRECALCVKLIRELAEAKQQRNLSRATDLRVMFRRHAKEKHKVTLPFE